MQKFIDIALNKGLNKDRTRRRRNNKIKEFINYYIDCSYYVYFFTFTFNDEHYPIDKRKFKDYLSYNKLNFILFLDCGEELEREHYHGYVATKIDLQKDVYNKFGFTKYRKIKSYNSYQCYTSQFYLSAKNFGKKIDRLLTCNKF